MTHKDGGSERSWIWARLIALPEVREAGEAEGGAYGLHSEALVVGQDCPTRNTLVRFPNGAHHERKLVNHSKKNEAADDTGSEHNSGSDPRV